VDHGGVRTSTLLLAAATLLVGRCSALPPAVKDLIERRCCRGKSEAARTLAAIATQLCAKVDLTLGMPGWCCGPGQHGV
jgi:hypothetical protein